MGILRTDLSHSTAAKYYETGNVLYKFAEHDKRTCMAFQGGMPNRK